MVRFSDKPQIASASLSNDDILPITDMDDNTSDKKVTIGQLNTYFGDNITTFALKDLSNTGLLADAIISAPNGVIVASADNTSIIVKNGLELLFANGRAGDNRFNVIPYTVASDISQNIATLADGIYELFISNDGSVIYTSLDNVLISRNEPTVTTTTAYWYDVILNYWKYTANNGSTWSNVIINALGQFTVESGVITEVVPDTVTYIPKPEALMIRDLSNITDSGKDEVNTIIKNYLSDTAKISDLTDDTATNPIDKANTLTGLTATASELNILDGATVTTAELNVLDGITANTTELNYTDGVTSNIQTQIDTLWLNHDREYQGVDLSVKFANEISQYATIYDWLNARKNAGNFSGIHVGDYMIVPTSAGTCAGYSIPAQNHKCRIIGINTYKRCADTDIGNMLYFSSDNVVHTPIKWNPTDNNNGTSVNNEPYLASAAYAILNGVNNYTTSAFNNVAHGANASSGGILQLLPSALQNVLKVKRNLLDTRYSASGLLTYSTGWGWKDMGKLWMPNEIEVYGCQVRSNLGYAQGYWNPEANLSIQFPWFANNCNHRIKFNNSGNRCYWWLSSANSINSAHVCIVNNNGSASYNVATYSDVCVPLCFCI